jgi:hypothetical protein
VVDSDDESQMMMNPRHPLTATVDLVLSIWWVSKESPQRKSGMNIPCVGAMSADTGSLSFTEVGAASEVAMSRCLELADRI